MAGRGAWEKPTREDSWQQAVALAKEVFGGLDGLVNNAGIVRTGSIEHSSLEDFEAVVQVNQIGTFLGMKYAIPAMRARGGGSIVNLTSRPQWARSGAVVHSDGIPPWKLRGERLDTGCAIHDIPSID